jgi:hypothetical protein
MLKENTQMTRQDYVERSGTITLQGVPNVVFPLFGPDREREWAEGWEPEPVYPPAVEAREGAVFRTRHGGAEAVWVVSRHDAEGRFVEYTTFRRDDRVTRIRVSVDPDPGHEGWSVARVTYALTALSEQGAHHLAHFTEAHYREMMGEWEQAINGILVGGA